MSTLGVKKAERGGRGAAAASEKVIKMMGMETEKVFENSYSGPIADKEFGIFWARVEDKPKEAAQMANVLLKKSLELLNGCGPAVPEQKGAASENKEEKQPSPELLASVSTMMFLALYYHVPDSKLIQSHLESYYEDEISFVRRLPSIKEAMRVFKTALDGVDLMGTALIGSSTLHTLPEFSALSSITDFPTLDPNSPTSVEGSFWYEWLRDCALESEAKRLLVLIGLTDKMLTLPQQMKMNGLVAVTTALSLFHMFRNIFTMKPITDITFLNRSYSLINQFFVWPLPVGNFAKELLLMIQREMQFPGSSMVAVLEPEMLVGQQEGPMVQGQRSRNLYYMLDSQSENARLLMQVMKSTVPQSTELSKRRPSHTLKNRPEESVRHHRIHNAGKAQLLMNFLLNDANLTEQEAKTISEINPASIELEYEKLSAARKEFEGSQVPLAELTESRQKLLTALKESLLKAKTGGQIADFPLTPPYICHLPLVEHVSIENNVEYKVTDKDAVKFMLLEYIPFPQPPSYYEHLEWLLHQHALEPKPCEIRVMICGGDKAMHAMLCAYLLLCQSNPPALSGLYFKFYVLPFGENSVGQYLARMDGWYRRHVYKVCMSKCMILPWCQWTNPASNGEVKKDQAESGATLMGRFLRENFTTYAREARHKLNVRVFLVKGWREAEGSDKKADAGKAVDKLAAQPDICIPFITWCEIGIFAQAEDFRKSKKIKSSVQEILSVSQEKSGFLYNPPELNVEFTPTDMRGHSLNPVQDDPEKYRTIVLRNVPKAGEKTFPPNPQNGCLELFAVLNSQKAFYSKNLLATEPAQSVSGARFACHAAKASFHVICDGESFGPFHHVVIEPARHPLNATSGAAVQTYGGATVQAGDPVYFPLQCFFPVL